MHLEKWKNTPEFLSAKTALIVGVIAHAFALVNPLHNYDNILQHPEGVGAGVTSGRWLLDLMGEINARFLDMNYNLPMMKGLMLIFLVAVSSAFLVNVLKIRSRTSAGLLGCLMVTFPTVCSTMAFRYTAGYYGAALLLSILAAWFAEKKRFGFLLSAVCVCCAMGIYQAYAPFIIGLFVLLLIRRSLDPEQTLPDLIRRGFYYCAILILGVLLYFVMVKVGLKLSSGEEEVVLDTYLGINNMGKISPDRLPRLIKRAFSYGALFAVRNYCGLAPSAPLKLLWILLILTVFVQIARILLLRRIKPLNIAFCGVMGLLFPLAINFQVVMCPDFMPYTIMVYSIVLVGCAPLMLQECMPAEGKINKEKLQKILAVVLLLISLYNGYYTNYNYTSLYYANRQVENYLNRLTTRICMTEGYTADKKWIFMGEVKDPMLYNLWDEELAYGGFINCSAKGLLRADYSLSMWFTLYQGLGVSFADETETNMVIQDPRVAQMPCWPDDGAVKVIDDYVVVKYQNLKDIK